MNVGVIGSGQMGLSIAIAMARFYNVTVITRNTEESQKRLNAATKVYRRLTKERGSSGKNIFISDDASMLEGSGLVVEAVAENRDLKYEVLKSVGKILSNSTLVVTNTSTLSISDLGEAVRYPERFFGCHFFNPPYSIPIVELSIGEKSDRESISPLCSILKQAGFNSVVLDEKPGFIVNRALFLMINEAIEILSEKTTDAAQIDRLFETALGHAMGPLRLADFIGLDTCQSILNTLYEEFKQSKYRPSILLLKKVRSGKLGRKTREGFYKYGKSL